MLKAFWGICCAFGLGITGSLQAQSAYYLFFEDKIPHPAYSHEADIPLNEQYLAAVRPQVNRVRHSLKWLNAISVEASDTQLQVLRTYPFIKEIRAIATAPQQHALSSSSDTLIRSPKLDTLLQLSHDLMYLDTLATQSLSGKGVTIALIDAGFKETDTHPALAALRERQGILGTYNFYEDHEDVYNHSLHGTQVLSCIAGYYGDKALGAAPDANFLLARTEHERKEAAIEEDHWIAAAQWAAEQGADIIVSAVTFQDFRYRYEDMDGQTTPVSQAARIAFKKGILVMVSMGNKGDSKWKYMGAPADAREVFSVGGSMPMMRMHIPFASQGPNYLKARKPNLSAPAYVVSAAKKGKYEIKAGTSFSCPLVAGIAACMMQQAPQKSAKDIFLALEQLGHFYPYYDYYLGYGVPDVRKLFRPSIHTGPTFDIEFKQDSVILAFHLDSVSAPNGRVLSIHFENEAQYLDANYYLRILDEQEQYAFRLQSERKGVLRIWFEGYLYEKIYP